jgi:hypothetical protein
MGDWSTVAKRAPAREEGGGGGGGGGGGMSIPMPKPRGGGGGGGDVRQGGSDGGGGFTTVGRAAPVRVDADKVAAEEKAAEASPGLNDAWVFWENRELPRGSARERAGDSYHHTLG